LLGYLIRNRAMGIRLFVLVILLIYFYRKTYTFLRFSIKKTHLIAFRRVAYPLMLEKTSKKFKSGANFHFENQVFNNSV